MMMIMIMGSEEKKHIPRFQKIRLFAAMSAYLIYTCFIHLFHIQNMAPLYIIWPLYIRLLYDEI
jgi:hypothetical protein